MLQPRSRKPATRRAASGSLARARACFGWCGAATRCAAAEARAPGRNVRSAELARGATLAMYIRRRPRCRSTPPRGARAQHSGSRRRDPTSPDRSPHGRDKVGLARNLAAPGRRGTRSHNTPRARGASRLRGARGAPGGDSQGTLPPMSQSMPPPPSMAKETGNAAATRLCSRTSAAMATALHREQRSHTARKKRRRPSGWRGFLRLQEDLSSVRATSRKPKHSRKCLDFAHLRGGARKFMRHLISAMSATTSNSASTPRSARTARTSAASSPTRLRPRRA